MQVRSQAIRGFMLLFVGTVHAPESTRRFSQLTTMAAGPAAVIVPEPFVVVQVWLEGWALIVMA